MSEISYELMQLWLLWYSSAAFFGSLLGSSTVLGIYLLYKKWRKQK